MNNRYIHSTPKHADTGTLPRTRTTYVQAFRGAPSGGCYRFAGTLTLLGLIAAPGAYGAPGGGNIVGGNGSIAQSGATTTITQESARLAINWNSFSSKAGESIVFRQPGASAIALNRVIGTGASELSGSLNANGQVFILNPNGILFGAGATVNAQGLLASTLNMDNASFMQGGQELMLENAGAAGSVTNQGSLTARPGGYVALIAPKVINEGSISAQQGNAWMSAGDKVALQLGDSGLMSVTINNGSLNALVDNRVTGRISANGGNVNLEAKAAENIGTALVNHDGVIEAQTLNRVSGRVKLIGDMQRGQLTMNGQIDVSAPVSGDGGAVETSAARVKILDGARVYARAREGVNGSWLIDPEDFSITAGDDKQTASSIGNETLITALQNGTQMTLATQNSSGTGGDIFVNAPVKWEVAESKASTLTLYAHRNIYINADMEANGYAGLSLWTGQSAGGVGTYFLNNAKINLASTATFTTKQGSNGELKSYTVITTVGSPSDMFLEKSLQGVHGTNNYVLGKEIDATATANWNNNGSTFSLGFTPIQDFAGILDGLGNRITGLFINRPTESSIGLFSTIAGDGIVRNVNLVNANITALQYVGILAGKNGGKISNVSSTGEVTGTVLSGSEDGFYIGGLVGQSIASGNIDRSSSAANVKGTRSVGGLVGRLDPFASITNSSASGKVTAMKQGDNALREFGGLLGTNTGTVSASYALGEVSAAEMERVGGLVGGNDGLIKNSYALGAVTGRKTVGGLVGGLADIILGGGSSIQNSYATGTVNAVGNNASEIGGLAGHIAQNSEVTNSYARGSVNVAGDNPKNVGGLIGYMKENGKVTNSYASGPMNITGNNQTQIGGLVGFAEPNAKTESSYWNTDSIANGGTGIGPGSGTKLGVGKTGKELMATETFANNGWDISNAGGSKAVWRIYDGVTMPLLRTFMQDVSLDNRTPTYNGTKQTGLVPEAPRLAITAATGTNVGTYSPSSTQQGYDIVGGNLTIIPEQLTVTTQAVIKTYDGTTAATGVLDYDRSKLHGEDKLEGGTYAFSDVNAGSDKTVSVSGVTVNDNNGGKNYVLTVTDNKTSKIDRAPLLISVGDVVKTYDGTNDVRVSPAKLKVESGTLFRRNENDIDKLEGADVAFTDPNAGIGNKTVLISNARVTDGNGGNNYDIKFLPNDTSTINQAPVTISTTNVVKTYDGFISAAGSATLVEDGGKLYANGKLIGGAFAFQDKNAGENNKTVNVTSVTVRDDNGSGNYAVTYRPNTTSTIKRAPLKATVNDVTKTYDGTTSAGGARVVYDGLVGLDKPLPSIITFADRNADSNKDKQLNISPIVISDGNNGQNYGLTYVPSTKSRILPAPLTISVDNVVKTYDGTLAAAATPIVSGGTLFGDKLADNALIAFTDRNVGTGNKTVTVSGVTVDDGNGGKNYQVSYVPNRGSTINPAVLTVSTGNVAKTYDGTVDAPGAAAAIVEGRLYAGDSLNGGAFAFADRNAGIGNKTVNVSGITVNDGNDGNNYLLRLSPNISSTISPAPLTVTANADRKTYDAAPYKGGNGVVIAGLVGGETADVLGGQPGYGGNAQGALLPGSYRITPAGLQSRNYAISYASGTLEIDQPRDLTSRDNLLNPMQPAGPQRVLSIGGATVQVAGCGVSLPANVLGVDCIAASAKDGR